MTPYIIHVLIDLVLVFVSYFFWNKSRDKHFLWFLWMSIVVVIIDLSKIVLYPSLSPTFLLVSRGFSIIFDILVILLVLKILFKKKENK